MDSLNPNMNCNDEKYNPFANRKKNATFNQEQLSYIKELVDLGWSASKIAKHFGLGKSSRGNINTRIKNNDWKAASQKTSSLSNIDLQKMKELIESGVSKEDICKQFDISIENLNYRIANNKWSRPGKKKKYTFDEEYFDNIDNEHKAYWLGFLYADGYILTKRNRKGNNESQSFGFSINERDIELAEKFKSDLQATNPINIYKVSKSSFADEQIGFCRILLTSQHTVDSLKKWGVVENKTFFLRFPEFLSPELIPHFIRGYSDGDGSISNYMSYNVSRRHDEHKSRWDLCGTKELLTGIKKFFGKDELKLYQRWPERKNNNYCLAFSGINNCLDKLDVIYKDATIYLQRKYDKYAEMQGRKNG